jgi:hypothetical protein
VARTGNDAGHYGNRVVPGCSTRSLASMASKSRPWLLWFLIVFFIWSVGKDFQLMFTLQRSVDFHIFDHHKLSTVFFAFFWTLPRHIQ